MITANQERNAGEDEQAHWHVDEEDRRPAELCGQDAAEQHPGNAAQTGHGAPDAQCLVSALARRK